MRRTAMVVLSAALLVLAPLGCGGDDDPPALTSEEENLIAQWGLAVSFYCIGQERDDNYGEILDGTPRVIDIFRSKADAIYETEINSRTVRQVLADHASMLEQCGVPEQAREIDRALDAGP